MQGSGFQRIPEGWPGRGGGRILKVSISLSIPSYSSLVLKISQIILSRSLIMSLLYEAGFHEFRVLYITFISNVVY